MRRVLLKHYIAFLLLSIIFISCKEMDYGNDTFEPGFQIIKDIRFLGEYHAFIGDDFDRYVLMESSVRDESRIIHFDERKGINLESMTIIISKHFSAESTDPIVTLKPITSFYESIRNINSSIYEDWKEYGLSKNFFVKDLKPFYTSFVNGNVSITADKTLFGKYPGAELSRFFNVWVRNSCSIGFKDLNFEYIYNQEEELPNMVKDYFANGTALCGHYAFYLNEIPPEDHDKITFKITIPCEDQLLFENKNSRSKNSGIITKENIRTVYVEYKAGDKSPFNEIDFQGQKYTNCDIIWRYAEFY